MPPISTRVLAALVLPWLLAICPAPSAAQGAGSPEPQTRACVLIDTDFDIDDMIAIPMVVRNRHVVAIVATEGATRAQYGASALARMLAQPGLGRVVPVLVGGSPDPGRDYTPPAWLAKTRDTMEHLNSLIPVPVLPIEAEHSFEEDVGKVAEPCSTITVLVLGPWTSFARYSPRLRDRIDGVIGQGRPAHSPEEGDHITAFNCVYDRPACDTAFAQLQGLKATWVDVSKTAKDGPYSPTLEMVQSLRSTGLPGSLRAALLRDQEIWQPTPEANAYGFSYLWDESAALYLLRPDVFHRVAAHMEPSITAEEERTLMVSLTNGE